MDKVLIHKVSVSDSTRIILFDILLPENYPALSGISATAIMDKPSGIVIVPPPPPPPGAGSGGEGGSGGEEGSVGGREDIPAANIPLGLLRLFIADNGDELFSEAVYSTNRKYPHELIGEEFTIEKVPFVNSHYYPLFTNLDTQTRIINGFYHDSILSSEGLSYTVFIYLHFENQLP